VSRSKDKDGHDEMDVDESSSDDKMDLAE